MNYKKIIARITVVFVGIILFLTFFSRTLVDLHIPRVAVSFADSGTIRPEAISSGVVRHADTERVFAPASGRITRIVERGDTLTARDILMVITSDLETLQNQLTQAEHDQRVQALNQDRTATDRAVEQARLVQLLSEPLTLPTRPILRIWEYDMQLETNENDINRLEDDLANLEVLYVQGAVPRQTILDREADLARLTQAREQILRRREQTIATYEMAVEAYTDGVDSAERNHQNQIQTQQNRIAQLDFTLIAQNMEMERIERRIYELTEQIADGGAVEFTVADMESTALGTRAVTDVMSGMVVGAQVQEGMPMMDIALRNNNFFIEASFPQQQDFIDLHQNVDIMVGNEILTGLTTRIVAEGGRNTVTITLQSGTLIGGELARVTVSPGVSNHANIIPISALREDQMGYFILVVEAQEGRIGTSYILRQHIVSPGRRDNSNVVITSPFFGMEIPEGPIVINSDVPVHAGVRVRLVAGYEVAGPR